MDKIIFTVLLLLMLFYLMIRSIIIVPTGKAYVIERMGAYYKTLIPGFHLKIPILDRIANRVVLTEQVKHFDPDRVFANDKTINVDCIVHFNVIDPKDNTYNVNEPVTGLKNITYMCLRQIIDTLSYDDVISKKDSVETEAIYKINEAIANWGMRVNKLEIKNIVQLN